MIRKEGERKLQFQSALFNPSYFRQGDCYLNIEIFVTGVFA